MNLRRLREEAGLTQWVIASNSGVSRMWLSLAESGQARLSPKEEAAVRKAILEGIEQQVAHLRQLLIDASD